jgi:hypothetical protein
MQQVWRESKCILISGRNILIKRDYVRIDLKKIQWEIVDWIRLCYDRGQWRALVNALKNFGCQRCCEFLQLVKQLITFYSIELDGPPVPH